MLVGTMLRIWIQDILPYQNTEYSKHEPDPYISSTQCCGTVTIYYGSGSGSDFEKLPVWFRFQLLKSYGSGSGPYFWKSSGSGSGSSSISKHKKQIKKKNVGNFFEKLFYKEKVHEFQQIYGKMWMKKILMKEIKYIILCLVPVPEP